MTDIPLESVLKQQQVKLAQTQGAKDKAEQHPLKEQPLPKIALNDWNASHLPLVG